jgi:serine/threonine-protein kinase
MIEKLGPYQIDKLLGRGGMGRVYAGRHEETGDTAAIKVLSMVLADDGNFRERFIAEIETLKKLDHPHIVRLYGEGEEDGYLFYVMELVEGDSLQAVLQSGTRFSWEEVVDDAIQICSALKHAHDRGVIHRDLKPANLLKTEDGTIKLTDFGIAKLFGGTQLTADGSVVGTADYMAPEQAEGKPITDRTDLYSLGSVMFTLLVRHPPFTAPSVAQVIHKLRYDQPPSVRRFAPTVPLELEQIVDQLLHKDPQERVPTALVLSKRLQAMRHALGDKPADTAEQPPRTFQDQPTLAGPTSPPTEASPAEFDDPDRKKSRGGYSWNDATVVTSDDREKDGGSATEVPLSSRETLAENGVAPPQNRFATVKQEELGQPADGQDDIWNKPESTWQIVVLAIALVALICAGLTWAWPPSADALFREINEISSVSSPTDANRQIGQFLERFPDDPRSQEVLGLQRDVESDWLQSRLALSELKSGGSQLEPYEQMWLDAMRQKDKRPEAARVIFEEIQSRYGREESPHRDLRDILTATKHQLERLEK